ncbi:MAG: S1 family peptidase, partial [Nocardioidaceae bacterium]
MRVALLLVLVMVSAGQPAVAAPSPGGDTPLEPGAERPESFVEPRIVGGGGAGVGEYPYFVSVQTASTFEHFCGGSLVSATRVLTAAHCVDGASPSGLRVVIGRTSLFDTSQGIVRKVSGIAVHPDWSRDTLRHDVAILSLSTPVTNADNTSRGVEWLRLAEPAESDSFEAGDPVTIIGHGAVCANCFGSSQLLEASVPIVSDETMSSIYGFFHPPSMIGAGPMEGGTDSCFGDSGGPLLVPVDGIDIQVGDTSWGVGCAQPNHPGGYGEVWQGAMWDFVDANVARPPNDRFAAAQQLSGNAGS